MNLRALYAFVLAFPVLLAIQLVRLFQAPAELRGQVLTQSVYTLGPLLLVIGGAVAIVAWRADSATRRFRMLRDRFPGAIVANVHASSTRLVPLIQEEWTVTESLTFVASSARLEFWSDADPLNSALSLPWAAVTSVEIDGSSYLRQAPVGLLFTLASPPNAQIFALLDSRHSGLQIVTLRQANELVIELSTLGRLSPSSAPGPGVAT